MYVEIQPQLHCEFVPVHTNVIVHTHCWECIFAYCCGCMVNGSDALGVPLLRYTHELVLLSLLFQDTPLETLRGSRERMTTLHLQSKSENLV